MGNRGSFTGGESVDGADASSSGLGSPFGWGKSSSGRVGLNCPSGSSSTSASGCESACAPCSCSGGGPPSKGGTRLSRNCCFTSCRRHSSDTCFSISWCCSCEMFPQDFCWSASATISLTRSRICDCGPLWPSAAGPMSDSERKGGRRRSRGGGLRGSSETLRSKEGSSMLCRGC